MQYAYYLHVNGDLICKNAISYNDICGDLVRKKWLLDTDKRIDAWRVVLEALGLGCNINRAKELISRWELTKEDSGYAIVHLYGELNEPLRVGLRIYIEGCLGENYDEFFDWLQDNPLP
jgi:hypothetical protein